MQHAVVMENVTHVYVSERGASLAVEDISLQVKSGEFISLVGPSGCGKTTLLSIIAGLVTPTQGSVTLSGASIENARRNVGYMLQQDYLYPWRSNWDNAIIGLELQNRLQPENLNYVKQLFVEMGLEKTISLFPQQLSGGMRQRVALVRTLATHPEVLLLDEPFSALDYQTKLQLEDLVFETIKAQSKTAVLVTHDISEAIAMSDRVIVLDKHPGRIRQEIVVPEHIRTLLPFQAREQAGFHNVFHLIWNEFEIMDTERGVAND